MLIHNPSAESRIQHGGKEAGIERNGFQERVKVTQTNLFERCKEILHSKFKTRKGGKESFNPIRDGDGAWRGKVIDERIAGFVHDMKSVVRNFGMSFPFLSILPFRRLFLYPPQPSETDRVWNVEDRTKIMIRS